MAVLTIDGLKALFEAGDKPTQQNYIDLVDTLAALPLAISSGAGPAGETGPAGENGIGFTLRGEWSSGVSYAVNDVVSFSGASYASIAVHTSSPGNQPPFAASWQQMAGSTASSLFEEITIGPNANILTPKIQRPQVRFGNRSTNVPDFGASTAVAVDPTGTVVTITGTSSGPANYDGTYTQIGTYLDYPVYADGTELIQISLDSTGNYYCIFTSTAGKLYYNALFVNFSQNLKSINGSYIGLGILASVTATVVLASGDSGSGIAYRGVGLSKLDRITSDYIESKSILIKDNIAPLPHIRGLMCGDGIGVKLNAYSNSIGGPNNIYIGETNVVRAKYFGTNIQRGKIVTISGESSGQIKALPMVAGTDLSQKSFGLILDTLSASNDAQTLVLTRGYAQIDINSAYPLVSYGPIYFDSLTGLIVNAVTENYLGEVLAIGASPYVFFDPKIRPKYGASSGVVELTSPVLSTDASVYTPILTSPSLTLPFGKYEVRASCNCTYSANNRVLSLKLAVTGQTDIVYSARMTDSSVEAYSFNTGRIVTVSDLTARTFAVSGKVDTNGDTLTTSYGYIHWKRID